MKIPDWFAITIILVTISGIALGRFPILRMNRATITIVGATILIILGVISLDQAYAAIDLNTITLLFSIMIINTNFRLSGFFFIISKHILIWAKSPRQLLFLIILSSGILSALFLNDTIVLVFTPLILGITTALKRNSIPYLIALATAANVGSAATIIGNPQNMIIGIASKITFIDFTLHLAPVSIVGMGFIFFMIILIYKDEFKQEKFIEITLAKSLVFRPLLFKSIFAAIVMLAALIAGISIPVASLGAACLLLVTRRLKPERVFREIDWTLLIFFTSLFIVTDAIRYLRISDHLFAALQSNASNGIVHLTFISTILSNLISNVPAVLVLRPFILTYPNADHAWLIIAMATTFAGNLTLLGSVANLIVAESAKRYNVTLTFSEYLKAGIPITIITLIIGMIWLNIFR